MSGAYFNENDPFAAAWLRELIEAGHIAPGDVDERDVRDVLPVDLLGYDQHHFFAGIGTFSYALRQAGWPDNRPVWTGSCPCQPFSAAGRGLGTADERHLWPAFFHLIAQCRPPTVVGEQVASKAGRAWFSTVRADLEGSGYTVGAADLCAAGLSAPHIRQRLFWIGKRLEHAQGDGRREWRSEPGERGAVARRGDGGLGHADDTRLEGWWEPGCERATERPVGAGGVAGGLGQPNGGGPSPGREASAPVGHRDTAVATGGRDRPSPADGFWRDADWLFCRDGKWRPVEQSTFPLAARNPGRVGKLRGYGNSLCAPVATAFIEAVMEGEIDVFA